MSPASPRTVAVVGAGWAGCAAAVELARSGCHVTLFESARVAGGRARRVSIGEHTVDNGQHIMLGAYRDTLRLMARVGIDADQALLKLPLQMRYPPDSGGMDFIAPRLPAPLHLLGALLRAKGLEREDKMSLARFSTTARWMGWQLHTDCSVSELLVRFDQTPRLIQLMWRPLCLAALNTPPERASAQVFLNVLRDSLGASRAASDMLIPRADLSALLPDAAIKYVESHGGSIRLGVKVNAIAPDGDGWQVTAAPGTHATAAAPSPAGDAPHTAAALPDSAVPCATGTLGAPSAQRFDAMILATPAIQAARLLADLPAAGDLRATLDAFTPEAITTCYLQYDPSTRLDLPFYALLDDPARANWGQFVFDRGQLDPSQAGLLAVVISASGAAAELGQEALVQAIAAQLAADLAKPALAKPLWHKVITEKRATFACAPAIVRPGNKTGLKRLSIAGDYTASDYPATLEAAVRSGIQAAKTLWEDTD
jgi:squalene-associated FAD-dependent desaturase